MSAKEEGGGRRGGEEKRREVKTAQLESFDMVRGVRRTVSQFDVGKSSGAWVRERGRVRRSSKPRFAAARRDADICVRTCARACAAGYISLKNGRTDGLGALGTSLGSHFVNAKTIAEYEVTERTVRTLGLKGPHARKSQRFNYGKDHRRCGVRTCVSRRCLRAATATAGCSILIPSHACS